MKICNKEIKMQIKSLGLHFLKRQILYAVCWLGTNAKEKLYNNIHSTLYAQEKQQM